MDALKCLLSNAHTNVDVTKVAECVRISKLSKYITYNARKKLHKHSNKQNT